MKKNNLHNLKRTLDYIAPTDAQKAQMLNSILDTSSNTHYTQKLRFPKYLYPIISSIILVIGSRYYVSNNELNTPPQNPDYLTSHYQSSPSQVGIRKFMNYNGNRYVVLADISDRLLNSLTLTNRLGILDSPIELYEESQTNSHSPANFSSTFALGSEVWETDSYNSSYRIIVKDNDVLYLCEVVGKSDDSEININHFILCGDFYNRISQIDIIPYSTDNTPIILKGSDCNSFLDHLSAATFIPSSSIDYDALFSAESSINSFNIIFKFSDGTLTQSTFYQHLSMISFGDNYFSLTY